MIRDAIRRVLRGEALNAVVEDWNRRGVPTATGKTSAWTRMTLNRLLRSPSIAGIRRRRRRRTAAAA